MQQLYVAQFFLLFFTAFIHGENSVICDYETTTYALETDLVRISFYEQPPSFEIVYLNTDTVQGKDWELTFSVLNLQETTWDGDVIVDYDISALPAENFDFECDRYHIF